MADDCEKWDFLAAGDKFLNQRLGQILPVASIGEEGISEEERMQRLRDCRQKGMGITHGAYETDIEGTWVQEDRYLPRLHGVGGPIRVLIHKPTSMKTGLPLVVWAHGGALTLMDCKDNFGSTLLKGIAAEDGPECCWVSVDYRLSPEETFPAPVDDMISVYRSVMDPSMAEAYGYSISKVGLAGVSAGGYLAAHAAVALGAEGKAPAFLATVCPMVDPHMATKSWQLYGALPICSQPWLRQSWQWALAGAGSAAQVDEERMNEASLLRAGWTAPCLKGLRTLLVLGRFDAMYDEGVQLGQCLVAAGLDAEVVIGEASHIAVSAFDPAAAKLATAWWRETLLAPGPRGTLLGA